MLSDLKKIRCNSNKTQLELSKLSGISDSAISSIEHGKRIPRIDTVCYLARGLGINATDLFNLLIKDEYFFENIVEE